MTLAAGPARFGPFFALDRSAAAGVDGVPDAASWLPVRALVDDPDVLTRRVDAVRRSLTGVATHRVAASVAQQGICARLVAPALALAVDGERLGPLDRLRWVDRLGGPFPLAEVGPRLPVQDPAEAVLEVVRPVVHAVDAAYHLGRHVAWGNVASSLLTAVHAMSAGGRGVPASAVAEGVLHSPEVAGTWEHRRGRFRRRGCCLMYRLSVPPAYCADCVLEDR